MYSTQHLNGLSVILGLWFATFECKICVKLLQMPGVMCYDWCHYIQLTVMLYLLHWHSGSANLKRPILWGVGGGLQKPTS